MRQKFQELWQDTRGATAIEMGLMALIAAAVFSFAIDYLGNDLSKTLSQTASKVEFATGANKSAGSAESGHVTESRPLTDRDTWAIRE